MLKDKKLIAAVIVVAVIATAMAAIYISTRPETTGGSKTFAVEVTHSDGSEKTFTYQTEDEYLGEVLLAEGLIAGHEDTFGLYIDTVDGEDAVWEENGAYWALYVGEEYASQGIDQTPVADSCIYKLVYTVG